MTHRPDPHPLTGRILDRLLMGEGPGDPPGDPIDHSAESLPPGAPPVARPNGGVDEAVAREHAMWARLLAAEARASDPRLDAAAATRIAARVRDRVHAEEAREEQARRSARSRPLLVRWAWVLGIAVSAHAAVFAVLGVRASDRFEGGATEPYGTVQGLSRYGTPSDESVPPEPRTGDAGLAPYVVDDDLLAVERARLVDPSRDVTVPDPRSPADFAPRAVRAMSVRSSDPMKRLIEGRVGAAGSLDRVKTSLLALAARQSTDGSWPASSGASPAEATALVLLAFLGDGHSSRGGEHQAVVERGIAWLRGRPSSEGGAYGLWALAEDYLLVNGTLTPAESRARSGEIADRTSALVRTRDAAGPAEARRLAFDAAVRVGVASRAAGGEALVVSAPMGEGGDPRGEAWIGAAILRAGRAEEFRTWAATASVRLRGQLGADGLAKARAGATEADRIADTALLLLALQTPYRTL